MALRRYAIKSLMVKINSNPGFISGVSLSDVDALALGLGAVESAAMLINDTD
jgi:hypothetical protein